MKDYELAQISLEELMKPIVERHLQGLTPEERVAGLTPEEVARALTPEQLAKALTPDQLVQALEALPLEVREQIKKRLD